MPHGRLGNPNLPSQTHVGHRAKPGVPFGPVYSHANLK
jgi:hypothetical protein